MTGRSIGVVEKASGEVSTLAWSNSVALPEASVVKLPFGPEEVKSFQQLGADLEVTLKSGEKISLQNFFNLGSESEAEGSSADQRSELILEDKHGVLWLGQYNGAGENFAFAEINEVEPEGLPGWVWPVVALLLSLIHI